MLVDSNKNSLSAIRWLNANMDAIGIAFLALTLHHNSPHASVDQDPGPWRLWYQPITNGVPSFEGRHFEFEIDIQSQVIQRCVLK